MATEKLSHRVEALGDMLAVLSRLTNEASTLLDILGDSLGQLGGLTAPIHSRATALTAAQRNVAATKGEVDVLLEHLETSRRVAGPLQAGPAADLAAFMEALESLERSVAFLHGHSRLAAVQAALGHAQALFNRALETCHADFASTLTEATREAAPSPAWVAEHLSDTISEDTRDSLSRDLVGPEVLPKLQRMAQVMLDASYDPVRDGYLASRHRALDSILRTVGQETPPLMAMQTLQPDALDRVISAWIRRMRALVLLALSEYRLAMSVWPDEIGSELYSLVVGRHLRQLAQAGRDICEARRVPEKLFALMDMHRHLQQMVPALHAVLAGPPHKPSDVNEGAEEDSADTRQPSGGGHASGGGGVQPSPSCAALLQEHSHLISLVEHACMSLFGEYEDVVARDASKILPPDGTIHPLTAQVISYLKRLLSYEQAADVLFGGDDTGGRSSGGGSNTEGPTGLALSAAVARLLMRLLDNLESKSRSYKGEPALAALFMMNNVHYVQCSVEGSTAEVLLGRDWLERHKDLVEDWGARYHDITWGPLLALLKNDAPTDVGRLKQYLKDTFSSFNAALERIYITQSSWTIPDAMLREAVKRVIKNDLLKPYQDFLRKFADVQFTATPAKYIKYTTGDIEAIVNDDLFEAKVLPSSKLDLKQQKIAAII